MINNKDAVQLSECCFSVCVELKTAILGKNASDLDRSIAMTLEDSGGCVEYPGPHPLTIPNHCRVMRRIERTLRRGSSEPHTKCDKEAIEGHVQEIQHILNTLRALSSPLGEDHSVGERARHLVSANSLDTAKGYTPETGVS